MKDRVVPAPPELFHSYMIKVAAVFSALGTLFGLGATAVLLWPGAITALTEDLIYAGITDPSSIRTWTVIHVGLILVGFLCTLGMTAGLLMERRGKGDGLDFMYNLARGLLVAVKVGGACALLLAIWRLVRYLLVLPWHDAGIYYAYVMLVPEAVMIAQAVGMYVLITRFLNSICDSAISMAYTRACGKLDSSTIPGFCGGGFLLLAAVNVYLAVERLTTVTIVEAYEGDYYKLLLASQPVLILAAGLFACAAVTNLLIGLYLRKYKRVTGRLMFRPLRDTLEK